jgi:hypothetical protein
MDEKQKLIGVDYKTKDLIDKNFSIKGFSTRSKYIKSLVEKDNPQEETNNTI